VSDHDGTGHFVNSGAYTKDFGLLRMSSRQAFGALFRCLLPFQYAYRALSTHRCFLARRRRCVISRRMLMLSLKSFYRSFRFFLRVSCRGVRFDRRFARLLHLLRRQPGCVIRIGCTWLWSGVCKFPSHLLVRAQLCGT